METRNHSGKTVYSLDLSTKRHCVIMVVSYHYVHFITDRTRGGNVFRRVCPVHREECGGGVLSGEEGGGGSPGHGTPDQI